jgi:hypothetical protein
MLRSVTTIIVLPVKQNILQIFSHYEINLTLRFTVWDGLDLRFIPWDRLESEIHFMSST